MLGRQKSKDKKKKVKFTARNIKLKTVKLSLSQSTNIEVGINLWYMKYRYIYTSLILKLYSIVFYAVNNEVYIVAVGPRNSLPFSTLYIFQQETRLKTCCSHVRAWQQEWEKYNGGWRNLFQLMRHDDEPLSEISGCY